jgi:hypothetical protein
VRKGTVRQDRSCLLDQDRFVASRRTSRFARVTQRGLWAFLAVALPVLGALLANLESVDLAYHLRAGGIILDTKQIPAIDAFTFTAAGLPWHDQQWAAEVILAVAYRAAGWTGLVVLRAILVAVLFGLVFDMCRRGNTTRTASLITLASFGLAIVTLALRPQLFGMVLFALTLWLTSRRAEHPSWFWLAVPVTIGWANLHGSFFLGPVVIGLAAVEDALTRSSRAAGARTAAVAAVALAATLVSPFGIGGWEYAVKIATNPVIANRVSEWQPTTPLSAEGGAFYVSIVLIGIVALFTARKRRGRLVALVWLVPFAAIGMRAVRGLAWWPIVAAVTVARLIASDGVATPRVERADRPATRRLNLVIAAAIVLAGIALIPVWRPVDGRLGAPAGVIGSAPPGMTAAIGDLGKPGDRLFAPQIWGSWFEFAVPAASVFVDSRIELFPAEVWTDYDTISGAEDGWSEALDRWDIGIVAVDDPSMSSLADRLGSNPRWREAYHDRDGWVFVRTG